jgi:hypothetical protein
VSAAPESACTCGWEESWDGETESVWRTPEPTCPHHVSAASEDFLDWLESMRVEDQARALGARDAAVRSAALLELAPDWEKRAADDLRDAERHDKAGALSMSIIARSIGETFRECARRLRVAAATASASSPAPSACSPAPSPAQAPAPQSGATSPFPTP